MVERVTRSKKVHLRWDRGEDLQSDVVCSKNGVDLMESIAK